MSTAILPDDSVVVRMPTHTVHIDATARAIHVREPSLSRELGGVIRATFPLESADRIRLVTAKTARQHLCLDLHSGETLDLGEVPSTEVAMLTAKAVADLTRCKIEVAQGEAPVAAAPAKFTEAQTYDLQPPGEIAAAIKAAPRLGIDETTDRIALESGAIQLPEVRQISADVTGETAAQKPTAPAPTAPAPTAPDPIGSDTLDMTKDEYERAIATSRERSGAARGNVPVAPSVLRDTDEDTEVPDGPKFSPPAGSAKPRSETPVDGTVITEPNRPHPDPESLFDTISDPIAVPIDDGQTAETRPELLSSSNEPDTWTGDEVVQPEVPVFQQLLIESQIAAAMSPSEIMEAARVATDPPPDAAGAASGPRASPRFDSLVELLQMTVESLPEAKPSLADGPDD